MKKVIIIAVFLSGACYGQKKDSASYQNIAIPFKELNLTGTFDRVDISMVQDSVKMVFDKEGNIVKKVYYTIPKNEKGTLNKN